MATHDSKPANSTLDGSKLLDNVPTLVIGLGGAGGNIAARIKRLVRQNYGDTPQISDLVTYMVVDADKFSNLDFVSQQEIQERTVNEGGEFLQISGFNPDDYYARCMANPGQAADLNRWFPSEDRELLPKKRIDNGASRCRPVGRFLLYASDIQNALQTKISEAFRQRATDITVDNGQLRIIIACSSCGGTGSSSLMDVVYLLQLFVQRQYNFMPIIDVMALGPEPFLNATKQEAPGLEPYYRANTYAFFREIDFLLKHPDRYNEFVMDSESASRRQDGGGPGNGLPPGQTPAIDNVYVFDGTVPSGVGDFADLSALYDYVARAVFYAKFVPKIASRIHSVTSNFAKFKQTDRTYDRKKHFNALGVAEVSTGDGHLLRYAQLRTQQDAILHGLVGDQYSGLDDDVNRSVELLKNSITAKVQILSEKLSEAASSVGATSVPRLSKFELANRKLDWKAVSDGAEGLKRMEDGVKADAEAALRQQDTVAMASMADLLAGIQAELDAKTVSLMDGQGILFLKAVLSELDKQLEGLARDAAAAESSAREDAAASDSRLRGGRENSLSSLVNEILDKKKDSMLKGLLDAAQGALRHRLEQNVHRLVGEVYRRLSGETGQHLIPLVFHEGDGRFRSGTTPMVPMLDQRIESLGRLELRLRELAGTRDPYHVFQEQSRVAQLSPTTHMLVDLDAQTLAREFQSLFPEWYHANNSDHQKRRQLHNRELLKLLNVQETGIQSLDRMPERDWAEAVETYVRRIFLAKGRQTIDQVLKKPEDVAKQLRLLDRNSGLGCRLVAAGMAEPSDKSEVVRIKFLGSPGATLGGKLEEGDVDESRRFMTLPDRWVCLRIEAVLPVWLFTTIEAQRVAYEIREYRNRPHIHHQFNLGLLEEIDPVPGRTSSFDSAQVFFSMYALSLVIGPNWKALVTDPERQEEREELLEAFKQVVWFDPKVVDTAGLREQFVYQVTTGPASLQGVFGLAWQLAWTDDGRILLTFTGTGSHPVRLTSVPLGNLPDRQQVLDKYRMLPDLRTKHASVLAAAHNLQQGQRLLRFACNELWQYCLRQLKDLRATPLYQVAIAGRAAGGRYSAEHRQILATEAFQERTCLEMDRIVKRLDGVIADTTVTTTSAGASALI